MKVIYDEHTDTILVVFKEVQVAESDESKSGVILDYDEKGDLVSVEILEASKRISKVKNLEFQIA
ncbi:MAG: DUF2283 domain-containing protein [Endomicrobia bacterium]|nr:DUF2283 domain-containing protein [Endomicrobiia bacterium]